MIVNIDNNYISINDISSISEIIHEPGGCHFYILIKNGMHKKVSTDRGGIHRRDIEFTDKYYELLNKWKENKEILNF